MRSGCFRSPKKPAYYKIWENHLFKIMTKEEHIERHKSLHGHLDELVADWIRHTGNLPSKNSVMSLLEWSFIQTVKPTEE